MNPRSVGIFAVVVAIIVGASIWFLNSDYAFHRTPDPEKTVNTLPAPRVATNTNNNSSLPPGPGPRVNPQVGNQLPPAPTPPQPVVITEDDKKIDAILSLPSDNSDAANTQTSIKLINLLPSLTPEGQVECISHINNLLPDEQYKLLMPIWKNPTYNADVLDAIATDLMNRDDKIKLPALLEAVRVPNHPQREEAKSTLQVFLDEDYEDNFPKWETAVKTYLKKQADEEAGIEPK